MDSHTHPMVDPGLAHQIRLDREGDRTRVTCNCGTDLDLFDAAAAGLMLAAYRRHLAAAAAGPAGGQVAR